MPVPFMLSSIDGGEAVYSKFANEVGKRGPGT
jgi:hypothetical protein